MGIKNLNLKDVPSVSTKMKYFDGDIYFADNITSAVNLDSVLHINFMALVFCSKGNIKITVNDHTLDVAQHDVLFINTGSYVEYNEASPDMSCKICAIKSEMSFSLINKNLVDTIAQLQESPVVTLTPEEFELLRRYYELADFKMTHQQFAGKDTVAAILRSFAMDLLTFIDRHSPQDQNILRQADKIYRRFIFLVTSDVDGHRSVKSYADELCVSPKYLTSICHKHAGISASEIITSSLVARIKNMLLHSDMSVKEIANQLGFGNLSFFGKFVKKYLGQSPLNYRKLNNYGL